MHYSMTRVREGEGAGRMVIYSVHCRNAMLEKPPGEFGAFVVCWEMIILESGDVGGGRGEEEGDERGKKRYDKGKGEIHSQRKVKT